MPADETAAACPWCGAALTDAAAASCSECGAVLRPAGAEPEVPGVTVAPTNHHQPEVAKAVRVVEPEIASLTRVADEAAEHEAFGPPAPDVRRAMLSLRLDEATAHGAGEREVAPDHVPAAPDHVPAAPAEQTVPPAAAAAGGHTAPVSPREPPEPSGPRGEAASATAESRASRRHPAPASFITEEHLLLGPATAGSGTHVRVGISTPSSTDDGWWLAVVFAHDDEGLVVAANTAPAAGPPSAPPLHVMGPVFAGALAGLIAEADGRQQLRLALPDSDPEQPWQRPLLLRVAIRWEPARAATLGRDELARQVLVAFRRAIEAAGRAA